MTGKDEKQSPCSGGHVVLGATSEIGRAIAFALANTYGRVILAARNSEELAALAKDLKLRTQADVTTIEWEATDFEAQQALVSTCRSICGKLDGVVLCHGTMAEQSAAAKDFALAKEMIDVNYTASVCVMNAFAKLFKEQKSGYLCGISSVAGDRGRQSNYLYGSTKAALSTYLAGLRNELFHHGISVITIKPGFVDTSMTWGKVDSKSPLLASPERVARDVLKAIRKRKNVAYSSWHWRYVMKIVCAIPECIFKRMRM